MKLIGYARVSTLPQSTDRQEADLLTAGVRADDLYVDQGVSGARASRPQFDRALNALEAGDTLVITTLDRLGRSTQNVLDFAQRLGDRGAGLRVLNIGGGDVDTATPIGSLTQSAKGVRPGKILVDTPVVSPTAKSAAICAFTTGASQRPKWPTT